MDMNLYTLEVMARDRLAQMRADAERRGRAELTRRASHALRSAVGHALIRAGHRLLGARSQASCRRARARRASIA